MPVRPRGPFSFYTSTFSPLFVPCRFKVGCTSVGLPPVPGVVTRPLCYFFGIQREYVLVNVSKYSRTYVFRTIIITCFMGDMGVTYFIELLNPKEKVSIS